MHRRRDAGFIILADRVGSTNSVFRPRVQAFTHTTRPHPRLKPAPHFKTVPTNLKSQIDSISSGATRTAYLEDGGPGRKGEGGAAAHALQGPAGCPRQCLKKTPTENVSSGVRRSPRGQAEPVWIFSFLTKNRQWTTISRYLDFARQPGKGLSNRQHDACVLSVPSSASASAATSEAGVCLRLWAPRSGLSYSVIPSRILHSRFFCSRVLLFALSSKTSSTAIDFKNACFGQGGSHPPDSLMPQGELTPSPRSQSEPASSRV
ncbi:uncharacterized protein RBU33_016157 [Hipposideros larvatus]